MSKRITQASAIWYKRRAETAEKKLIDQRNRWASEWRPGWVHIESAILPDASFAKVDTARKLGHAVIVIPGNSFSEVMFYADPLN